MTRLHVYLDGGMTVGMRGAGASSVGHGGMLGILILGGAGSYGILGGGEAVGAKPWDTHITNMYHSQAFLITMHEKQPHSNRHTCKQSLKQSH